MSASEPDHANLSDNFWVWWDADTHRVCLFDFDNDEQLSLDPLEFENLLAWAREHFPPPPAPFPSRGR